MVKRDPLEAINRWQLRMRNRPDNVKTEAVHGGFTDKGSEFPITLGREFSGVIIDAPHGLEYDYPIGMKVIGYLPPHQKGCLVEVFTFFSKRDSNLKAIWGQFQGQIIKIESNHR